MIPAIILLLSIFGYAQAEIVHETGTLKGFLMGEAPGCVYDNYMAHVVEGVADPGYNHYNPLDPQTNGFGHYQVLTEDSTALLDEFYDFFSLLVRDDSLGAEIFRQQHLAVFPYHLVRLHDPDLDRDFLLFREELDSSYVDENLLPFSIDDEVGSFNYGWGLYIFNPGASHGRTLVEIVHPNDDFITLALGYDYFVSLEAGALFVSGAGREVVWTEQGDYSNSKSLSDPSRNEYHVFQSAHRAFVDYYIDEVEGVNPFAIQVHSYDSEERDDFPSLVVTPHRFDTAFNPPLFDWSGILGGMIDRTPVVVQPAGVIGNPDPVLIEDFYGTNSLPRLVVVDSSGTEHLLPRPNELWGYSGSIQMNYRSDLADRCNDPEWFMHVEYDELPNSLPEEVTESQFYADPGYPLTWRNFAPLVAYYHPAVAHLREALDTLSAYDDHYPPVPPQNLQVLQLHIDRVLLGWEQARDPYFDSYRLYYALEPGVTVMDPFLDDGDYPELCAQETTQFLFRDLEPAGVYYFRLAGVDLFQQHSELSNEVAVVLEDTDPPVIRIVGPEDGPWLWWQGPSGVVRARFQDDWSGVDGAELQFRCDVNQDGDYGDAGEEWQPGPLYADSIYIEAEFSFAFQDDPGGGAFELRARDLALGDWRYSGVDGTQGILDDWRIYTDTQAPAAPEDFTVEQVNGDGSCDLSWSPLNGDTTFYSYVIYYSPVPVPPDTAGPRFDREDFPTLGEISSGILEFSGISGAYLLALAAEDWAGNRSSLSNPIQVVLQEGTPVFLADTVFILADDNGNFTPEPGETVSLAVRLHLNVPGNYHQVSGRLSTWVSWLHVTTAEADYPDFGFGEQHENLTPFVLQVDPDAPYFFHADMLLTVSYEDTSQELGLTLWGGYREIYYNYNAEQVDGWTHEAPAGWNDQWHLSQEDAHSLPGSWKCGDTGDGDYANHQDARLVSPLLLIQPHSQLSFYHRINAELSGSHPDSAYDGGILELSADGGASWEQLFPEGTGYNAWFHSGSHAFPTGTPCFSGELDWRCETVDLSPWDSTLVHLRFHFSSDNSVTAHGWLVDDIQLAGALPVVCEVVITRCLNLIQLTWEAVPAATSYRVYGSDSPYGGFTELAVVTSPGYEETIVTRRRRFYRVTWE